MVRSPCVMGTSNYTVPDQSRFTEAYRSKILIVIGEQLSIDVESRYIKLKHALIVELY